ncbi:hypothetical protein ACJX0J_017941, partial [Zea mays]
MKIPTICELLAAEWDPIGNPALFLVSVYYSWRLLTPKQLIGDWDFWMIQPNL